MFSDTQDEVITLQKENFQKELKSKIMCSMSFERKLKDAITFKDLAFFMQLVAELEVDLAHYWLRIYEMNIELESFKHFQFIHPQKFQMLSLNLIMQHLQLTHWLKMQIL